MGYQHDHRCKQNYGCQKKVMHPVKKNVMNCYTEEVVKHVHPSHTTVKKHHMIKNEHVYPHTTSVENYMSEENVGKRPPNGFGQGNQVGGTMDNQSSCGMKHKHHHHHQQHCSCGQKKSCCGRRRRRF